MVNEKPILAVQCSPVETRFASRGINSGENSPSPNHTRHSRFLDHIMIYAYFPFPHRFTMIFSLSFPLVVHPCGSQIMTFKVTNPPLTFTGGLGPSAVIGFVQQP